MIAPLTIRRARTFGRRLVCTALLAVSWSGALGIGVVLSGEWAWHFDFLDESAWRNLHRQFFAGGTLPFSFVVGTLGAVLLWLAGLMMLLFRGWRLSDRLPLIFPAIFHRRRQTHKRPKRPPPLRSPAPRPVGPPLPDMADDALVPITPLSSPPTPSVNAGQAVAIARALAIFDVWQDPPATWMKEALQEELALLSDDGWNRLRDMPGTELLACAHNLGFGPGSPRVSDDGPLTSAPLPAAPMTLPAALLGELLDNYLMAEKNSDPVEGLSSLTHRERADAKTSLHTAMAAMTEQDWASLDRFPEQARHIRITTDQLREAFREPPIRIDRWDKCRAALNTLGFQPARLPMTFISADPTRRDRELVLTRGAEGLILHYCPLGGDTWTLAAGLFGAWQISSGSSSRPSPARSLWQRLALLSVFLPEIANWRGFLAVSDGRIVQVPDGEPSLVPQSQSIELVQLGRVGTDIRSIDEILADLSSGGSSVPHQGQ